MATVRPEPAVADGRLYALCRSLGPYPEGVAFGETFAAATSVRTQALQAAYSAAGAAQARAAECAADETGDAEAVVAYATTGSAAVTAAASRRIRARWLMDAPRKRDSCADMWVNSVMPDGASGDTASSVKARRAIPRRSGSESCVVRTGV